MYLIIRQCYVGDVTVGVASSAVAGDVASLAVAKAVPWPVRK